MIKLFLSLFLIAIASFACFAQNPANVSLIIKSCDSSEGSCSTQHLFRYDFLDGKLANKKKILTTETSKLRFDIGENRIYKNRYLITNWGDVVDLSAATVVHESDGKLIDIVDDNVIIEINREDGPGIFSFNLTTNEYGRVKSPSVYDFEGTASPDKAKVASYRFGKGIVVTEVATGKRIIIKKEFSVGLSSIASEFGKLPLFWLDNHRLLTQKQNGEVVLVELNGRTKVVAQIPIKEAPYTSPAIYRNSNGEIIYHCYSPYVLDIENRGYREYDTFALGNEFYSTVDDQAQDRFVYFHKNIEIGRDRSIGAMTTTGYLAVKYSEDGSNLGHPDGVKVWNIFNKEWIEFPIKWSPEIIGWVEE